MDFEFDARTEDYRKRLLAFMDEHVYPAEATFHTAPDSWEPPAALEGLKAAAKEAGLRLLRYLDPAQCQGLRRGGMQSCRPRAPGGEDRRQPRGAHARLHDLPWTQHHSRQINFAGGAKLYRTVKADG